MQQPWNESDLLLRHHDYHRSKVSGTSVSNLCLLKLDGVNASQGFFLCPQTPPSCCPIDSIALVRRAIL